MRIVDRMRLPHSIDDVPELPDLEYIVKRLAPRITGRKIIGARVTEPIVIRMLAGGSFEDLLPGRRLRDLSRHGPFLRFRLEASPEGIGMVVHCMLSGRFQIAGPGQKPIGHLCFALELDDGSFLRYGDDKKMGKVYVTAEERFEGIPGYLEQGIDITSEAFTFEAFEALIHGRRHQARVFLMDQTALSAIGNAYADEILFAAGIHPKTPCRSLSDEDRRKLYDSVRSVMAWGIAEVEKADRPIEEKVRDHVKVRGRHGEPCPACGTKIRREGVLGYDAFFCPRCQPDRRTGASGSRRIPWVSS
jgi:formamidopyrimidine-DNA glycosylase